jgi:hypothetical protein
VNTAFYVVFTLFVLAMAGLAFTAVRWAVRRDKAARTGPATTTAAPEPDRPTTGPVAGP